VPEHQELDVLLVWSATSGSEERRRTRKYMSENSMELLFGRGERMLPVAQTTNRGN